MRLLVSSASSKLSLLGKCASALLAVPGKNTLVAGDSDPLAVVSFFDYDFLAVPETVEKNRETIAELLQANDVDMVLPTRDGELLFWASNKSFFSELGISPICSSLTSINLTLDKLDFFKIGKASGIPMIFTTEDPTAVKAKSLVVKERVGSGSKSMGISLNHQEAFTHGRLLEQPLYQPFISGVEISVDIWRSEDGSQTFCSPRKRIRVRNGEAIITSTFRDDRIEKLAKNIVEVFEVSGPSVLQLIVDSDGYFWVIELNPRIGGASTASIESGLPLIELCLRDELGLPIPETQPTSKVVSQIRFPKDLYFAGSID